MRWGGNLNDGRRDVTGGSLSPLGPFRAVGGRGGVFLTQGSGMGASEDQPNEPLKS